MRAALAFYLMIAGAALPAVPALAQTDPPQAAEFDVDGKDVMWLPTPDALVDRMLNLARVGPRDVVYDLGSGDGRIPIAAARRFGATGVGIEYDAGLVELSRKAADTAGVASRVRFLQADLFEADFSEATVVTLYLLRTLNVKLRPKILALRPGTRVVSNAFGMGDWAPDVSEPAGADALFLWHVPAQVAGRWTVTRAGGTFDLVLEQTFQKLRGEARVDGHARALRSATLEGAAIRLGIEGLGSALTGRVEGDAMHGGEGDGAWRAQRQRGG
ncbi:MAG TPA: class I SAM-dependent methyltransferase [Burkholderiales bacterium]